MSQWPWSHCPVKNRLKTVAAKQKLIKLKVPLQQSKYSCCSFWQRCSTDALNEQFRSSVRSWHFSREVWINYVNNLTKNTRGLYQIDSLWWVQSRRDINSVGWDVHHPPEFPSLSHPWSRREKPIPNAKENLSTCIHSLHNNQYFCPIK